MSITRINNNIGATIAYRNITAVGRKLEKTIERLSSGLRINRASDDAAGLVVATRLNSQVQGLDQAVANAQDGMNVINVAEGSLHEITTRLDRIRVLAIQAANTGVNDLEARQALQDEVFQSIDEISRISKSTQFGKNYLLNGDFDVVAQIKPGQDGNQFGVSVDTSPSVNTLSSGASFLNIIKTQEGFKQFIPGIDSSGTLSTMHVGVQNATDIAVTLARFSSTIGLNGTSATAATLLGVQGANGGFFNGVSINNGDLITFQGVLSDGVTIFSGTLSASAISSVGQSTDTSAALASTRLLGAINQAIDRAETALFGVTTADSVPTYFRTTVTLSDTSLSNRGRLLLVSDTKTINLSSINLQIVRNGNIVTQSQGVTRSGPIGLNSVLSGVGQVGNSITSITGSTFSTGKFTISVEDVQKAQNRIVAGNLVFRDKSGTTISRSVSLASQIRGLRLNGNFVNNFYTGGVSISDSDTLTLRGTEADGTTFEAVYSFSKDSATDTVLNDFKFTSISGLIAELNYRTRDYVVNAMDGRLSRFETAMFTYTSDGRLQLIDDLGRNNSNIHFMLTLNDSVSRATPSYTLQDNSNLIREGFAESATIRINGGPGVRAEAGQMVTVLGPEATKVGEVRGQITFRLGSNLKVGTDILDVVSQEYIGRLNGGPPVTFQNGSQGVKFIDGSSTSGSARVLSMNFSSILDITKAPEGQGDTGTTLIISTVSNAMNFHIGAFAYQSFQTTIGELSAENLGFGRGSGRTVNNLDIRTLSGANEAITIIDRALDQVNRTLALLGAATNRLESTVSNLSVSSENLLTSESRLRDADIAKETAEFTKNQVILQAGISVLTQANTVPQNFLNLLR